MFFPVLAPCRLNHMRLNPGGSSVFRGNTVVDDVKNMQYKENPLVCKLKLIFKNFRSFSKTCVWLEKFAKTDIQSIALVPDYGWDWDLESGTVYKKSGISEYRTMYKTYCELLLRAGLKFSGTGVCEFRYNRVKSNWLYTKFSPAESWWPPVL